jgi:hypothetical protein
MSIREKIESFFIGIGSVICLFFILVALHELFRLFYLLIKSIKNCL